MSALKFLSKKSWHTANIKNSEKVWLKEQAEAKEKSRIEELRKQIEEERKLKEAEELEVKAGRLEPEQLLKRRRINWMYEFGPNESKTADKEVDEKECEDVLTGKKEVTLGTLEEEQQRAGPSMIDMENKMREDPLLDIKRQRMQMVRDEQLRELYSRRGGQRSERAEKLKRKQHRQAVREERRRRREARGPVRSQMSTCARDYKEAEDLSLSPRRESSETARRHSTTFAGSYKEAEDLSLSHRHESNEIVGRHAPAFENKKSDYGLRLPERGSQVEVSKRFIPRRKRFDQPPTYRSAPARPRRRFDQPPGFTSNSERRATNYVKDDTATMLDRMRRDAEQIDIERKMRTERHESDGRDSEIGSRKRRFGE